jgi:hypothetical protein
VTQETSLCVWIWAGKATLNSDASDVAAWEESHLSVSFLAVTMETTLYV